MRIKVAVGFLSTLLLVSWVAGDAPYPPSGYKPKGPQFTLPNRESTTTNQGIGANLQPQTQYGPPSNQYGPPKDVQAPPEEEYLPTLDPTDFRNNFDAQREQGFNGQGQGFGGQQGSSFNGQQAPSFNGQQVPSYNGQQVPSFNGQQGSNFGVQQGQGFDASQKKGFNGQQDFVRQQDFLGPNVQTNDQQRNYLPPNQQRPQQETQRVEQQQDQRNRFQKQQLYETPNSQDANDTFDQEIGNNDAGRADNYLPPTTTTEIYPSKPTKRRRYPEPTTKKPDAKEADPEIDDEEEEPENPNVAISTAVARGQYYLLQPDGRLQRVVYKTTQTQEELKNQDGFSARLVYQNVDPIYTYNAPLIRVN